MVQSVTMGRPAFAQRFVLVLCLAGVTMFSGCRALLIGTGAAAVGAAVVVYIKGNADQTVDVPLEKLHAATVRALKELQLPLNEDKMDYSGASMKSEYADGTSVWITLTSMTPGSTKIRVRVGIMGEMERAREIINKINQDAGLQTPEVRVSDA